MRCIIEVGQSAAKPNINLKNKTRGQVVRVASLEIHKEELSFSAGHFTIFSATEREHIHGHNYYVSIAFNLNIQHNGLSFDYRHYKKKMLALCNQLDRYLLLPSLSPYLKLEDEGEYVIAYFNNKKMSFLKDDVVILPVSNITIEELSHWFLQKIIENPSDLERHAISAITVKVYNGPGQSGGASWSPINA